MASEETQNSWSLSPSYDIGVKYTFRNLLKDNPYRQSFFRHWLATLDHENIKKYYNYETGERKKKGDLSATEIHYDQVQKMVYDANLPRKIEDEIFYHLDYHLNRENKSIDFLKLKEFFAFCGVDGVYDLDNGKHFLMEKEHPFLLDNLRIDRWSSEDKAKNREIMARMMAKPGEIPFNRDRIVELREQYGLEWLSSFSKTDVHDKFMGRANSIFGSKRTPEEVTLAAEEAKKNGVDLDEYDKEIEEYTKVFDQTPEAQVFLSEISALETDEAEKLRLAVAKYIPDELLQDDTLLKSYDENLGQYGLGWDEAMHDWMADADQWAALYLGHEGPETCSKEPPTDEERAILDPELLELGEFQMARYEHMMRNFNHQVWPAIRSRYCAFEDWILRDYTMNPINKGELAKARREDIPVLFKQALRDELNDNLLRGLNFPIRVEKNKDDEYDLYYNDIPVETFNPKLVLEDEFEQRAMSEPSIKQKNATHAANLLNAVDQPSTPSSGDIDFKIHTPGAEVNPPAFEHDAYDYRENTIGNDNKPRNKEVYANPSKPMPKSAIGPKRSPGTQAQNGGKQMVNNQFRQRPPYPPRNMGMRGAGGPLILHSLFAEKPEVFSPIMDQVEQLKKITSLIQSKNMSGTPLESDLLDKIRGFSDGIRADMEAIKSGDMKSAKNGELKQLKKGISSLMDGILEAKDPDGLLSEAKEKCLESLEKTKESIEKAIRAFIALIASIFSRS